MKKKTEIEISVALNFPSSVMRVSDNLMELFFVK